jgi:hypothetical protein
MKEMKQRHPHFHVPEEPMAFIKLLRPKYGHIANRLELIWGSPECDAYINSLFMACDPDRGPARNGRPARVGQGFPAPAMRAIETLREIHPRFAINTPASDAWGFHHEKRVQYA